MKNYRKKLKQDTGVNSPPSKSKASDYLNIGGVSGGFNSGFSLIEMVVVIFAFGIILTIVGSLFSQVIQFQRRATNAQKIQEDVNLVMESMAREIRVSQIAGPDTNCPTTPAGSINLTHPVNGAVSYTLNGSSVQRTVNGTSVLISSNTVQYTRLQFCITGTAVGNQPRITIIASLQTTDTKQQISGNFQTTLSTRILNQP